ncbi:MAG TPA: hydroxymethylglutaryl-CoA lyase [Oligoflexia bacterium]|nr:hydroxymethylglutaryl-CoA lyase [Oligoflexia bacterium]HMP27534.1 hydroxymethylglutaryl-CoA lyase [Oligoflexia bacterium]
MTFPTKIYIRELAPREGFQALPTIFSAQQKVDFIDLLSKATPDEIEVTSFVRADLVPQMADAAEVAIKIKKNPTICYSSLYLNQRGFLESEKTGVLQNRGWIHFAISETFLQKNSNTSNSALIESIPSWVECFRDCSKNWHGIVISTVFGCNYENRHYSADDLIKLIRKIMNKARQAGIDPPSEISLADTMGWGSPTLVRDGILALRAEFNFKIISLHLHDTRGSGMVNAYVGLEEGIDRFDASCGGLGGCPFAKNAAGNIPTEDLVYLCQTLKIKTSIDLDALCRAAHFAEKLIGAPLNGKYSRYKNH